MIRGSKEKVLECFVEDNKNVPLTEMRKKISGYRSNDLVVIAMTFGACKSRKQNSLFHGLLNCFWDSGCSSFGDPIELRDYYKKIAGLIVETIEVIEIQYPKVLQPYIKVIEKVIGCKLPRLKAKRHIIKNRSWADVDMTDATRAIQTLMYDMDESGVLGSSKGWKYREILIGINQWFSI